MMAMLLYPFSCSRRKNLRNFSKDCCMEVFYHGDTDATNAPDLCESFPHCRKSQSIRTDVRADDSRYIDHQDIARH